MNLYEYQRSSSFIDLGLRSLRFNFFKLFLKNTRSIKAKFHIKPPRDIGMKIYSNVTGHMTKMVSRAIYDHRRFIYFPYVVETIKICFFGTKRPMTLKLGIQYHVLKHYHAYSNDETGLTLVSFMTWSNLFRNASAWVKAYSAYRHYFQCCSNSAYPMHSGERYRSIWSSGYLFILHTDMVDI